MTEQHEAILERLMRLDPKACVRMRPTYQRPARWYVFLGSVVAASRVLGQWTYTFFENGCTPEEALENTWAAILKMSATADGCFLRYRCTGDVPIPGDEPQVWVRWSEEADDWVDVVPNAEALRARNIPADRIRPYMRSIETVSPR